ETAASQSDVTSKPKTPLNHSHTPTSPPQAHSAISVNKIRSLSNIHPKKSPIAPQLLPNAHATHQTSHKHDKPSHKLPKRLPERPIKFQRDIRHTLTTITLRTADTSQISR